MAGPASSLAARTGSTHSRTGLTGRDPVWLRRTLIGIALATLGILLVAPLAVLFAEAFRKGANAYFASFTDPNAWHAIVLTLTVAAIVVPLNAAFGVAAAWCIARFRFPGRSLLLTLIDLPFAVSPVVAGLLYILLFGAGGWFSAFLEKHDIQIIFALPGIVLATAFTTIPFVARELIPMMEQQGDDEELAALTLGANGWQMFRHVTLPKIKWGLFYGVILCNARAMGEFGAVCVVSGSIRGETTTLPLHIEILYNEYQFAAAFAIASLLALLAIASLLLKTYVEWRATRTEANAST